MFNLEEKLLSFLNLLQLKLIGGLCWILNAIEEFIFALTDLSFINESYYEILESYKTVGFQIIIALTIGYVLYAMLLKPTDMTGILKNVIFASVVLSSFGALFNFITVDVGSNIANSLAPESEQFIFSQSILKYSVRDYSNPDNDYYFDFTNKTIHDVETDKFLKNDVVDDSGEIIAKKGDLQYPVLMFSGLVYGIVLLVGLLLVSIITTKNIIEIFISGIVGIFAISFNIGAESKFFRNYISILSLTLGKIIANIVMLTLYATIVKTISTSVVSSLDANATVSFVIELVVNCSMIWVILSGSDVFKRTFGIDLGLSDVAAGNIQSSMLRGLVKAPFSKKKNKAAHGTTKSDSGSKEKSTSTQSSGSSQYDFKSENTDPFINTKGKQTTDAQNHKENNMGIDTKGMETREEQTNEDHKNKINPFEAKTKGMQVIDDNKTSIKPFEAKTNEQNDYNQEDSSFKQVGIDKYGTNEQSSEKQIKPKSTPKNSLGVNNFRNDKPNTNFASQVELSKDDKTNSKSQQKYKSNIGNSNVANNSLNGQRKTKDYLDEKQSKFIEFNDPFETGKGDKTK